VFAERTGTSSARPRTHPRTTRPRIAPALDLPSDGSPGTLGGVRDGSLEILVPFIDHYPASWGQLHDNLASFVDPPAGAIQVFQRHDHLAYSLIEPRQRKEYAALQELATAFPEGQLSRLNHQTHPSAPRVFEFGPVARFQHFIDTRWSGDRQFQ
jgi:hypothetical protein